VRVDADHGRVGLEHPMRLGEGSAHLVLVEVARFVAIPMVPIQGDHGFVPLGGELAAKIVGPQPTHRPLQPYVEEVGQVGKARHEW
jgi:hypothetical protein